MPKPTTIDEYIAAFPEDVQIMLEKVRATIKKAAPDAEEMISYNVPAFKQNLMLVWFAAHSNHIGLYPRGSAIEAFNKELSIYKCAKGSVQFPFSKPIPLALISKIVKFRVAENKQRAELKKKK
jgi:uncharacterized protein YdhG (YjbR/CyaY superfamily)